jgi:uncharacterized membrane-anchored protein
MRLSSLRRGQFRTQSGTVGRARLDRRTRSLLRRLQPGDIAVIDHVDIDHESAVALVEAGVGAVVDVAPCVSGRYPNLGPQVLIDAGVPIVDNVDPNIFNVLADGDVIRVEDGDVFREDQVVARGQAQDAASISAALASAQEGIATQLDAFSANATEHLRRERALLLDGEGLPDISTDLHDRHVVVVRRAFDYASDLAGLKAFIRENDPVLVGVDAGADALLQAGLRPHLVVTDLEAVSDRALRSAGEVVLHTASGERPNGADRLDRLGVRSTSFVTGGTTQDAAILLAHARDARLIVLAGSHASIREFLDLGPGMASSFLTRAVAGSRLVDARAVAQLYRNRVRAWLVLVLILVGVALVAAAVSTTPVGQDEFHQLGGWLREMYSSVRGRL